MAGVNASNPSMRPKPPTNPAARTMKPKPTPTKPPSVQLGHNENRNIQPNPGSVGQVNVNGNLGTESANFRNANGNTFGSPNFKPDGSASVPVVGAGGKSRGEDHGAYNLNRDVERFTTQDEGGLTRSWARDPNMKSPNNWREQTEIKGF